MIVISISFEEYWISSAKSNNWILKLRGTRSFHPTRISVLPLVSEFKGPQPKSARYQSSKS